MQPVFRDMRRNLPFLAAGFIATGAFAVIIRKVFYYFLLDSRPARLLLSALATFFFVSLTTFLLKTARISDDVGKLLG